MKPWYNPSPFCDRVTKAILAVYDNADFSEKEALNRLTSPLMMCCKNGGQMSRKNGAGSHRENRNCIGAGQPKTVE